MDKKYFVKSLLSLEENELIEKVYKYIEHLSIAHRVLTWCEILDRINTFNNIGGKFWRFAWQNHYAVIASGFNYEFFHDKLNYYYESYTTDEEKVYFQSLKKENEIKVWRGGRTSGLSWCRNKDVSTLYARSLKERFPNDLHYKNIQLWSASVYTKDITSCFFDYIYNYDIGVLELVIHPSKIRNKKYHFLYEKDLLKEYWYIPVAAVGYLFRSL